MAFIKFDNVSFSYKSNKSIIKEAKFEINQSDFIALIGPNGSGKTTLGKLAMGILKPTGGKIYIQDCDVDTMTLGQVGRKIGYLFQNPELQIFALTVMEELSFALKIKNISENIINDKVDRILKLLHLDHHRDSLTFNLSYGEKQRLAIAGILINEPHFLILDEPTTGLDLVRKNMLLSILKNLLSGGVGVMVISHDDFLMKNFSGKIFKICGGEVFEEISG